MYRLEVLGGAGLGSGLGCWSLDGSTCRVWMGLGLQFRVWGLRFTGLYEVGISTRGFGDFGVKVFGFGVGGTLGLQGFILGVWEGWLFQDNVTEIIKHCLGA